MTKHAEFPEDHIACGLLSATSWVIFSLHMQTMYRFILPLKPTGNGAQKSLPDCLADIEKWLADNFLHLNEGKTECVIFGDAATSGFGTLSSKFRQTEG